jgi:hypothetical protein
LPVLNIGTKLRLSLGNILSGVFTPGIGKTLESFSLIDCTSVGVDRMQRNVEPMRKQVEAWQRSALTDVTAKVVIYEAQFRACLRREPGGSFWMVTLPLKRPPILSSRVSARIVRLSRPQPNRKPAAITPAKMYIPAGVSRYAGAVLQE